MKTANPEIYLTFDDGPDPQTTPYLLYMLKQWNVRATFFCVGEKAEKHPDLIKDILTSGHTIGCHGYQHISAWRMGKTDFQKDTLKCNRIIPSSLYRPPYGRIPAGKLSLLQDKYHLIMWSLMSYDFHPHFNTDHMENVFLKGSRPGFIWLFHDAVAAKKNCFSLLPRLLEKFTERGFVFCKISNTSPLKKSVSH